MSINDKITAIRTAKYGRDVRTAIADGIAECYSDVSTSSTLANAAATAANAVSAEASKTLVGIIGYTDNLNSIGSAISGSESASGRLIPRSWVLGTITSAGGQATNNARIRTSAGNGYTPVIPSGATVLRVNIRDGYACKVIFRNSYTSSSATLMAMLPADANKWYSGDHSINLTDTAADWYGATYIQFVLAKASVTGSEIDSSNLSDEAFPTDADILKEIADNALTIVFPPSPSDLISGLTTPDISSIVGAVNSVNDRVGIVADALTSVDSRVTSEAATSRSYTLSQVSAIQNLSDQWGLPTSIFTTNSWRWSTTAGGAMPHGSNFRARFRSVVGVYIPQGTVVYADEGYTVNTVLSASANPNDPSWIYTDQAKWAHQNDDNNIYVPVAGYLFVSVAKLTTNSEGATIIDDGVENPDISEFVSKVHISGPFIASKFTELSDRVATLEVKADIPASYFITEANRIRDILESSCGEPSYVIGFVTDSHYSGTNNWDVTAKNMAYLNRLYPFDCIVHGGDITTGNKSSAEYTKPNVRHVRDTLLDITPNVFMLTGNHDDNSYYVNGSNYYTDIIDAKQRYSIYGRHTAPNVHSLPGSNAWYWDIDSLNLRVICLDALETSDNKRGYYNKDYVTPGDPSSGFRYSWGYSNEELSWFSSVLDDTLTTGHHLVIFSHMPFTKTSNQYSATFINGVNMANALNSFVTSGGIVVALFHGHTHWDYFSTTPRGGDQFLELSTGCSKYDGPTGYAAKYSDTDSNGNVTVNTMNLAGTEYVIRGDLDNSTAEKSRAPLAGTIAYDRKAGDKTEELWDVIVVTPGYSGSGAPAGSHGRVKMLRFGAGVDREFYY